ncbi:MAG: caspase family protein [Planctomycetes bacterium]|nr:caspase family protein [Planctomycetota bacterium]
MRAIYLKGVLAILSWIAMEAIVPRPALADGRLYVVIATDDRDGSIGPWVSMDGTSISSLLLSNVDERRLRPNGIEWVSEDRIGADAIVAAIRSIPSDSGDTILFFYSGHGAYDDRNGHYFSFSGPDGYLTRSRVLQAIQRKRPRLGILISDCCYSFLEAPPLQMAPSIRRPAATTALFRALLFESRGIVDITSSEKGQSSFVYEKPEDGSLFTAALWQFLDKNQSRSLSWQQVFEQVRDKAAREFRKMYPQGVNGQLAQTAWAFSLPPPERPPSGQTQTSSGGTRFGVTAVENGGNGVRVTRVRPDYPGVRCEVVASGQTLRLEPGDVILSVNGRPLRNLRDYWNLVKGSPSIMEFTVRDRADGQVLQMRTTLATPRGARFGVTAVENGGDGVRVTVVRSGYPGSRGTRIQTGETFSIEVGDVLLSINGQDLHGTRDFVNAVGASPREMQYTVRDRRSGTVFRMKTTLRY